jgi:hypothetical protein
MVRTLFAGVVAFGLTAMLILVSGTQGTGIFA